MRGRNLASVRAHNRGATVRLLSQNGALSRRQSAPRSGLNASTITHIVSDFLRAGLVQERAEREHDRRRPRGRREVGIEPLPDGAFAVGVHVAVDALCVAVLAFERLITEPEWYAPTRLGHRAGAAGPSPASLTSLLHG